MPNIQFNGHRKPWEKRANKGFKADGSAFTPFYNAQSSGYKMYDSGAWKTLRVRVLQKFPICPVCIHRGLLTPSVDVDHIKPHQGQREGFYDEGNLWALCKKCHAKKSAFESNKIKPPKDETNPWLWWVNRINKTLQDGK
jgi:5-methylcytosine-specific restriction endonuclease McrA